MNLTCSVAICTHNGAKFVKDQLQSIIAQSKPVDEIVICDDNSSDNTVDIVCELLQSTSIPFIIETNRAPLGITKNFEKCIGLCSGDIIFLCDQDDIWVSSKVERMIAVFERPTVMVAFSDATAIDDNGSIIYSSWHNHINFMQCDWSQRAWINCLVREGQIPNGCFMAIRRELVNKCSDFFVGKYQYHDAWLINCAVVFGDCYYLPEQLTLYRLHSNSTTQSQIGQTNWQKNTTEGLSDYEKFFSLNIYRSERIMILKEIIKRFPEQKRSYFYRQFIKATSMYDNLTSYEQSRKTQLFWMLIKSFWNGSYYYRNANKGDQMGFVRQARRLLSDLKYCALSNR